jgi:TolB protein
MRYLFVFLCLHTISSVWAQEPHLANITQLTFGGDNAEAYFSPDSKKLAFQSNNAAWGLKCDQIFALDIKKAKKTQKKYLPRLISTGKGRTTCSYYMPNNKDILYASTHEAGAECPPAPDYSKTGKYLWAIFESFDIFIANKKGNIIKKLTNSPGYDAEATVNAQGTKIVFTSLRSGDLELWTMDMDGSNQKQITFGLGYDGGAFFSPDGKKIVFRASRPQTEEEQKEYKELLAQGLVAPTNMEIYTCNVDGSDIKQITKLGKANWAPYYHPDNKRIVFSSNHASTGRGFNFQVYIINEDGTGLKAITSESQFNAFPMFSPDGKKIAWSSNRNNNGTRDTNVFIADWVENP